MDYLDLRNQYGLTAERMVGQNEKGEMVLVDINESVAYIRTYQANGWTRINVYWADGATEELYEKEKGARR